MYYKNDPTRLSACPLTIHALLHIAWGIRVAGPVWTYWAYPMEQHCNTLLQSIRSRHHPHTHLLVRLSLQLHSSIKSNYYMIYMKHYAWIPMKRKAPNLYMICVGSVNHSLLVTHVKYKQIRTTCLLPPDDATSCPRRYETKISLF